MRNINIGTVLCKNTTTPREFSLCVSVLVLLPSEQECTMRFEIKFKEKYETVNRILLATFLF